MSKIAVNERSLRAAAKRLLSNGQICWNEIFYLQESLPTRTTQVELDDSVVAVRKLSWEQLTAGQ